MADKRVVEFIIEARKRRFSDIKIKEALLKKGWFDSEIDLAFSEADKTLESEKPKKISGMKKVCAFIDEDLFKQLEKRAKKSYLSVDMLIDDIIRRSMLSYQGGSAVSKIKCDDALVGIFSRERKGRKRKTKI